jgi:hypothetical protein
MGRLLSEEKCFGWRLLTGVGILPIIPGHAVQLLVGMTKTTVTGISLVVLRPAPRRTPRIMDLGLLGQARAQALGHTVQESWNAELNAEATSLS